MIIHWNQNPFLTSIEVNETDIKNMRIKYQRDEYVNILADLDNYLNGRYREEFHLDEAKKKLSKRGVICNLTNKSEEILDIVDWLNDIHCGDCTCVAASCMRCYAEELFGIDTISGCGKHELNKIFNVFCSKPHKLDETITIDQAIEKLSQVVDYKKPENWPDSVEYEKHIPRWIKERENALKWLTSYKERYGF